MHLDIRLLYPHTQSQFTAIDTNFKMQQFIFAANWRRNYNQIQSKPLEAHIAKSRINFQTISIY